MPPSRDQSSYGTQFLERWLVPILLIVVGLLQLYLAQTADLSPWKGGGFGMFAAIDAPGMRVLAAEGLTQTDQLIRLDVLDDLDYSTRQRIRTLPKASDLEQLTTQLLAHEFVPMGARQQSVYQHLQRQNPNVSSKSEVSTSFGASEQGLMQELPAFRMRRPTDPIALDDSAQTLKAVRLRWWRLRFDADQVSIRAEPLSRSIEAGEWN